MDEEVLSYQSSWVGRGQLLHVELIGPSYVERIARNEVYGVPIIQPLDMNIVRSTYIYQFSDSTDQAPVRIDIGGDIEEAGIIALH